MYELGKKKEIAGAENLRLLKVYGEIQVDSLGRPTRFPVLLGDDKLVAGYDQGLGERMIVCESLEDMQQLWDSYAAGWALNLNWYAGDVVYLIYLPPAADTKTTE